jgi:uncharacterized protein (TIGR00255 family)
VKQRLRSMTGFGRAEVQLRDGLVVAEVRSVNSRHLDVRMRLPRDLTGLEPQVRQRIGPLFRRGQVEVGVRLSRDAESGAQIEIDREAARRYAEAAEELRRSLPVEGSGVSVAALLSLPGVARLSEPELDPEAAGAALLDAVAAAAEEAAEMRGREGAALERELRSRLGGVLERVGAVEARSHEVKKSQRERLVKRLAALAPEIELDPARLEQEVVLYVDRMDVTEETVRLRSHCEQFSEALTTEGPVGRKLEFILQEMGRETNTIGSKASDGPIAREVVELKAELEKLREQVLNVE